MKVAVLLISMLMVVGCGMPPREVASAQIEQMAKAIRAYHLQNGVYPASLSEAAERVGERFPNHDPWERVWLYECSEDGFSLRSEGPLSSDDADDIFIDSK